MPRVSQVKKAQKDQGSCGRCGTTILKGSPYVWWAFRYGGKRKRCTAGKCAPRSSDLTQSKMSGAYAAQEAIEDFMSGWQGVDVNELQCEGENCVSDIEAVADEYTESAEAIRETFPESPTADECEEKAEMLMEWADLIRTEMENLEEFDGELDKDGDPKDDDAACLWRSSAITEIEGVLGDCPA